MTGTATEWNQYTFSQQLEKELKPGEVKWVDKGYFNERLLPKFDDVEKPAHYNKGGIEAIQYIRQQLGPIGVMFYCEGNSLKYGHRWRYKSPINDLGKKEVYSKWMREEIEKLRTREGRQAWYKQLDELTKFVQSFE